LIYIKFKFFFQLSSLYHDDFLEFETSNFDIFVFIYVNKADANPIIDLSMFERDET
jgi:hypothetical protein